MPGSAHMSLLRAACHCKLHAGVAVHRTHLNVHRPADSQQCHNLIGLSHCCQAAARQRCMRQTLVAAAVAVVHGGCCSSSCGTGPALCKLAATAQQAVQTYKGLRGGFGELILNYSQTQQLVRRPQTTLGTAAPACDVLSCCPVASVCCIVSTVVTFCCRCVGCRLQLCAAGTHQKHWPGPAAPRLMLFSSAAASHPGSIDPVSALPAAAAAAAAWELAAAAAA